MFDFLNVWGMDIPISALRPTELEYLRNLPASLPTLEWVWNELDRVWDELGLDNKRPLLHQSVAEYYRHPVWLLNGFFSALDPISVQHREAIANFIFTLDTSLVADYGGGFGELALRMSKKCPDTKIHIVEPYPSQLGVERTNKTSQISFISALGADYDVIVAQDVLEHVDDPVGLAYMINFSLRNGGLGIYANNFYPIIKCHLPANFYLRNSFPRIMSAMGMHFVGYVDNAPHALIFERIGNLNLPLARLAEQFFRLRFLFTEKNNSVRRFVSSVKKEVLR